jgi:hypothetical protein
VAHACNPSYAGGRDQEDHSSKPAQANSSTRPYLEKPFTKIGLVKWLKVKALSSSPVPQKKNKCKEGKAGLGNKTSELLGTLYTYYMCTHIYV